MIDAVPISKKDTQMLLRAKLAAMSAIVCANLVLAVAPTNAQNTSDDSSSLHGTKIEMPKGPFALILGSKSDNATQIEWQDLMPAAGQGTIVRLDANTEQRKGVPTLEEFSEYSPEDFKLALQDIGDMRSMQETGAAIRTELDGKRIKIAGYMTPVGFDDTRVTEFLLVPYLGACIHVPPPPANQIVYVDNVKGIDVDQMWEPIWVTGTLRATPVATVLADVGYSLEGATVEPYE
jgi:hypothetical protein